MLVLPKMFLPCLFLAHVDMLVSTVFCHLHFKEGIRFAGSLTQLHLS